MQCENPILAIRIKSPVPGEKSIISILPKRPDGSFYDYEYRYGKDNLIRLPCGKCTACREAYRADWSIRCDMEARYHVDNCFLTLTYRPDTCPRWVSKGHLRKFIRKLRKTVGLNFSYFACGEYGETNGRPHMHLIIFGYFPQDAVLKPDVKSKSGFEVYESKLLNEIWNKGFVDVNNFSQDTAFYVAGYVNKKTGQYDGFLNMSNGIGYQYMMDNFKELYERRYYIARSGRVHHLPRAFKRVAEKLGYPYEERPEDIVRMRKLENSEMIQRGFIDRGQLRGITTLKMKDKLQKRLKRL